MNRSAAAKRALAVHRRLMRFGEADTVVTQPWIERDTTVRAVEAHLARLWTDQPSEGDRTVTEKGLQHARASVLNLIVMVPDEASATRVVESMTGLGVRHPSRAVVLSADPDAPGPSLTAAIVVGGTASAGLVYLSGVPSRMADRLTVFWGGSPTTRLLAEASASVMAALAWSLAMLVLFRPG